MYPCNDLEARDDPAGKAESKPVLLQAFPRADPTPRAVFSSPGCSSRQESRYGTATTVPNSMVTTTNAAILPPWTSSTSTNSSVIGRLTRSARAVVEDMISTTEQNMIIQDHEHKGFLFSDFSSQQKSSTTHAYMRAADHSGFTNTFPATILNQKLCSGSQKGFHPCRGFLINGGENSETKLQYDIGSSNWNVHADQSLGLIQEPPPLPQTASSRSYNYDTGVVVESRIQTATSSTFLHQGSLIQTAAETCINPVSNMELLQGMEATEDNINETHILMCPQDHKSIINMPRISDHHDNSCPNKYDHKGKSTVQDHCLWDSNWSSTTAEQHDHLTDHYHFGEDKSADSAVISTNQLLKFFSCPADQYAVGCQHVGYSYPYPCYFDVKELEEREWTKLLQKELTNSDVGALGRIVLPKKEAEANLPPLLEKEGLLLEMVDMANHVVWGFKYRFWPNNRSRMYILENTGDFAKMNKLEIGDSLVIYGDGKSRYYLVGVEKKERREKMIRGCQKIKNPEMYCCSKD